MAHPQRCSTGEIRSSASQPAGYPSSTFKHKSHLMAKQALKNPVDQTIARNKQAGGGSRNFLWQHLVLRSF